MGVIDSQVERFRALFSGLDIAYGTGKGEWVKRPPMNIQFINHLEGNGPGIGIAPLRPDNTVMFAAIDLDEPDFAAAREMQDFLKPFASSFIEKSRSGNAHIWVFFKEPIEAWVPMGVLKETCLATGKKGVEVFPKNHDFGKVRLGNYINLPYHGDQRPILRREPLDDAGGDFWHPDLQAAADRERWEYTLDDFLDEAEVTLNDPEKWRTRARHLLINSPDQRERTSTYGEQRSLHICAEHVLSGEAGVVGEGHRNAVLFMLASCLSNWQDVDHDETLTLMREANEELFRPPETDSEVRRILSNVERAGYTSTRCDDPLVLPYAHPDCRIANPRR